MESVYLCVLRDEMIVYKRYLGQTGTSEAIHSLLGNGELVPSDSWSEVGLIYEKYNIDDLKRNWDKIVKSEGGLENLDNVPTEGTWGILYENSV
ncbi:MAG: hypothetical protein PXY39_13160 [archaeon]|nr:hypothetical protein [archaeon]